MCIRYRFGAAFLGMRGALDALFWMYLIVFPFVNIYITASMAANCELQMLAGTSLSCVASALECEGVVYFCANILDLVLCAIGSLF